MSKNPFDAKSSLPLLQLRNNKGWNGVWQILENPGTFSSFLFFFGFQDKLRFQTVPRKGLFFEQDVNYTSCLKDMDQQYIL